MISTQSLNIIKYCSKYAVIILIIFIILKFILNTKSSEAILLSCIIAVSIIIVENIISINSYISDPLNCDQCKINMDDKNENNIVPKKSNYEDFDSISNIIPDIKQDIPKNNNASPLNTLNYINNKLNNAINNTVTDLSNIVTNISSTSNNNAPQSEKTSSEELFDNAIIDFEKIKQQDIKNYIDQQSKINNNISTDMTYQQIANQIIPTKLTDPNTIDTFENFDTIENFDTSEQPENFEEIDDIANLPENTKIVEDKLEPIDNTIPTKNVSTIVENKPVEEKFESIINTTISPINVSTTVENKEVEQKLEPITSTPMPSKILSSTVENKPIEQKINNNLNVNSSYDANYVQYQQDGKEAAAANESLKNNLFKLNIGDKVVTEQYIKDGKNYYDQILSYSTNAPSSFSAMENELKYSNYNYIGPLNRGMANKEYTFISPTNWYPIPPVPPVCVTNKSCTTCPIQMSDGNDYMQWASLDDFDKARRFTGDMNINIDYIKNVLNNPDGY